VIELRFEHVFRAPEVARERRPPGAVIADELLRRLG
jgi:hypothetical protein